MDHVLAVLWLLSQYLGLPVCDVAGIGSGYRLEGLDWTRLGGESLLQCWWCQFVFYGDWSCVNAWLLLQFFVWFVVG
jgi:hypothetical protein